MGVEPRSRRGELYDLRDSSGGWSGSIADDDLPRAHIEQAVYLKGAAGSVTVHNCCSVHGSAPNMPPRPRPLLLQTSAAGVTRFRCKPSAPTGSVATQAAWSAANRRRG